MNKKGFFGDLFFIGIMLLVAGLCGTFLFYVLNLLEGKFEQVAIINGTDVGHSAIISLLSIGNKMDYLFSAVMLALILGILVTSWLIPLNFVFAAIYFIVALMAVALSAILSNVWQMVALTPTVSALVSSVPITNHVLSHLPIYLGVICFLGFIAMFAKPNAMGLGAG
jgi:hypothetical protein